MNFHPENHKGIFSEDLDDGQPSQKHARRKNGLAIREVPRDTVAAEFGI